MTNFYWGGKNGFLTASSNIYDGMPDSTKAEPTSRSIEEMDVPKSNERQRQKERGQKFMIFIGSPGVEFDSFEKDLTLLSTSYKMRPYSYGLVRRLFSGTINLISSSELSFPHVYFSKAQYFTR